MGLKYRAHPLAVAMAYEIFKQMEKTRAIRQKFAERIVDNLKKIRCVRILPAMLDNNIEPSWYALVFRTDPKQIGNDELCEALKAEGLSGMDVPGSTSPLNLLPLFQDPTELFPVYKDKKNYFSYNPGDFPKAEEFYKSIIKMPVGSFRSDGKLTNLYIKGIIRVAKSL